MTNDLISRQAAIDALEREKTYCTAYKDGYTQTDYFKQYNMGLTDGIKALNKLPSAQPEVVRCKDCRHANECHKNVQYTRHESNSVTIGYSSIEWCSRGERRTGC